MLVAGACRRRLPSLPPSLRVRLGHPSTTHSPGAPRCGLFRLREDLRSSRSRQRPCSPMMLLPYPSHRPGLYSSYPLFVATGSLTRVPRTTLLPTPLSFLPFVLPIHLALLPSWSGMVPASQSPPWAMRVPMVPSVAPMFLLPPTWFTIFSPFASSPLTTPVLSSLTPLVLP